MSMPLEVPRAVQPPYFTDCSVVQPVMDDDTCIVSRRVLQLQSLLRSQMMLDFHDWRERCSCPVDAPGPLKLELSFQLACLRQLLTVTDGLLNTDATITDPLTNQFE